MIKKKSLFLIYSGVIIFILIGVFFFMSNDEKDISKEDDDVFSSVQKTKIVANDETSNNNEVKKKNKYYFIYLKQDNGDPDTSWIPEELNPNYKDYESDTNISITFNDDGTAVEDEKMILINNYKMSDDNKNKIERIVGEKKYPKVLKEIQQQIKDAKDVDYNSK